MNNKDRQPKVNSPETNVLLKPSYKVPASLTRFINGRGMILPSKTTKISAKLQRQVATEIKRARFMGLIPYTYRHKI